MRHFDRDFLTATLYSDRMRVHVDSSKCQGHNRCYALVPDVFEVDEFGQASARYGGLVPVPLEAKVRLAADNCPEYAITITE